jgi:hypothetical protein
LSTAEEEYVVASSCAQDVIWLRGVLSDLTFHQKDPTVTLEDNTAAIKWSSGSSRRAKHIDLKVCFVHKIVSRKQAIHQYVPTYDQLADILTRPLEANVYTFCWHEMCCLAFVAGLACVLPPGPI